MTLLEPDVALTDLALAIECGLFAGVLHGGRQGDRALGAAFVAFFSAAAAAAFLGFVTHGFLPDDGSLLYRIVWSATLAAVGAAALASWVVGARLVFAERAAQIVVGLAALVFLLYLLVILFVSQSYWVAIAHYLPAALFLLTAFSIAYRRRGDDMLLAGVAGVMLTFVAAGVQQAEFGFHLQYFNHNAVYHAVQAIAFFLIFLAARAMLRRHARA